MIHHFIQLSNSICHFSLSLSLSLFYFSFSPLSLSLSLPLSLSFSLSLSVSVDVALLTANASQLKYLLQLGKEQQFFYLVSFNQSYNLLFNFFLLLAPFHYYFPLLVLHLQLTLVPMCASCRNVPHLT